MESLSLNSLPHGICIKIFELCDFTALSCVNKNFNYISNLSCLRDRKQKLSFIQTHKGKNLYFYISYTNIPVFIAKCIEYDIKLYSHSSPCSQKWYLDGLDDPFYENEGLVSSNINQYSDVISWEGVILNNDLPLFKDAGYNSDNLIYIKEE